MEATQDCLDVLAKVNHGKPRYSGAANARAAIAALDSEVEPHCAQAENDCASSSEDERDSGLASMLGGSGGGTG